MTPAIKPGAFLRRGQAGVSAETMMFLIEHKDELQAVYDGLGARRDAALEAIAASEGKLAATEAAEATLAADRVKREADLADVLIALEAREKKVARGVDALVHLDAWFQDNPFNPLKET